MANLYNFDSDTIITGTAENDTISNEGSRVTIEALGGNDYVSSNYEASNVSINAGDGDDTIHNEGSNGTIDAGAGNDSIISEGDDVIISAGAGNNTISNGYDSDNVTIETGAGDDYFSNDGNVVAYVYGGGNDTIQRFGDMSTLVLGGLSILSSLNGEDYEGNTKYGEVRLNMSDGSTVLLTDYYSGKVNTVASVSEVEHLNLVVNYESNTVITGTNGRDSIFNDGENVTINSGEGDDIINNNGASTEINTGDGNDDIYNNNSGMENITMNGGNGDDTIYNDSNNALISGGTGNDSIRNNGINNTVESGSGDDFFWEYGYGTAYVYSAGNDTIEDFNDTGALVLGNVNILSSVKNGYRNYILNLDNGNTIFLQNYYSSKINTVATASEVEKITEIDNYNSDTVVTGTATRDSIYNSGENVTVNAGAGNDTIRNYSASAVINGQDDNDYISNDYSNVTISGGAGNDSIENRGDNALINGDADNDSISNNSNHVSISGGEGNDSIQNSGVNVTATGGAGDDNFTENGVGTAYIYGGGNDTLYNFGTVDTLVLEDVNIESSVQNYIGTTLNLSNGNTITLRYYSGAVNIVTALADTEPFNIIKNSTSPATVTGTDAKDYIENNGASSTVSGGAGDDFIKNFVVNSSIAGGIGNDTISNGYDSDNVTINAGAGSDSVYNDGDFVLIDTGAGSDSIYNNANNVTTTGGAGNDSVLNSGGINLTIYDEVGNDTFNENGIGTAYIYGGGSDTLEGFTIFDALILGEVSINSSVEVDNGINLNLSNGGTIVLENFNSDTLNTYATLDEYERYNIVEVDYDQYEIAGTSGKDYIDSWRDNVTINAGAGNDYIQNSGDNALVASGEGNDYIYNYGSNAKLMGTAGNDSLVNRGDSASVVGGAGNDSLVNNANNVTVAGGAGNDSVLNSGGINLTIYDEVGNDYFNENGIGTAYIYGGGSDTLEDFKGYDALILGNVSINSSVKGEDDNITLNLSNGKSILLTNYDSDSINALATLDEYERFNIIENDNEFVTVEGTDGKDYIENHAYNAKINGNAGDDYIYNTYYSDVSINGGAGNDTIVSYRENVTVGGGAGNDVISIAPYYENNFVEYSAGNDTVSGFGVNTTLIIAGGSYSSMRKVTDIIFTVGEGSIVLKDSASLSAINVSDGTKTTVIENEPFFENITITDNTESPVTFQTDAKTADASARRKAIQITGNELDNTITGGKGNDTLDGAEGNDILTGGKGKNLFVFSGGNDVITDYDSKDKLSIGGGLVYEDYTLAGEDLILNFGTDNILTITGGADKVISYLEDKKTTTTEYTADEVILGNKKKSATLTSAVESFDATSSKDYSKVVTIDGSATGAIEITGNKKKNYIIAGTSGTTITGGKGNDTLLGGAGADLFIYENKTGKDVIENFGEGDSINLDSEVTIKDAKTKGSDTVLKFKGGALTVKDTTEFNIGETVYRGGVFIAGDSAKVYGSFRDAIDLANYGVNNFDGSAGKKRLSITGTDSANSLTGGKGKDSLLGGAGNDILWGGKGNDTLWGGAGDDTFIYQAGQGKDLIADYAAGDLLTILNKKGEAGDFKKATFKNDTLTLGIQGGGKVLVSGVDTSTAININGNSRTVSELVR